MNYTIPTLKETIKGIEENIEQHHKDKGFWQGLVYPVHIPGVVAHFKAKQWTVEQKFERTHDQDLDWVILKWDQLGGAKN